MRRLLVLAAAVAAGVVTVRRSVKQQQAERHSWAEATDGPAPSAGAAPTSVVPGPADSPPPTT